MRIAMRLMLLTFLRTQELRMGEWSEIDFDAAEWRVPASHMKMAKYMLPGEVHIVPLSRQALALLRELHTLTGNRQHLFPNIRNPKDCMSRTAINRAIERMGYGGEFSGHGFRSTASTYLHEHGWNEKAIERQLAHAERNKIKAAYNHAEYMTERREMMQAWADWIDSLTASRTDSEASATPASDDAS
jgi:integrase